MYLPFIFQRFTVSLSPFNPFFYLSGMKYIKYLSLILLLFAACHTGKKSNIPLVGFVDAFEDATIAPARTGFADALNKSGFSEQKGNVKIEYRNAEGSIPTLTQIVNYFVSQPVDLMATCTTLSSITRRTKNQNYSRFYDGFTYR